MRIATAESEKEEVKRQLHDMKLERDQLTSEVETLRLKLMEFARSHDGQEVHPEVERRFAALAERYTVSEHDPDIEELGSFLSVNPGCSKCSKPYTISSN